MSDNGNTKDLSAGHEAYGKDPLPEKMQQETNGYRPKVTVKFSRGDKGEKAGKEDDIVAISRSDLEDMLTSQRKMFAESL